MRGHSFSMKINRSTIRRHGNLCFINYIFHHFLILGDYSSNFTPEVHSPHSTATNSLLLVNHALSQRA